MGDLNSAIILPQAISIPPQRVSELGALDDDLGERDAGCGVDVLDDDVDAGAETEDEGGVLAVED